MAVGQKCLVCHRIYDAAREDFGNCCSPACADESRLKAAPDPIAMLEAMIRADVVIDFLPPDGEFAVIARRRGEDRPRTYTGRTLADAVRNTWEHEKP